MAAAIERIAPGHGRSADSISLLGSGFSSTPGQNMVIIDGIGGVVTLDSATQVDVTVPGGVGIDRLVEVLLTNLDDATQALWWWWVKDSTANLASKVLPVKIPFRDEIDKGLQNSDPRTAESKMFERYIAALELLAYDLVNAKGALATMSTTGLRQVAAGVLGDVLSSFASGAVFLVRESASLEWGRQIPAATVGPLLMEAGGVDTLQAVVATEELVLKAGRIAIVSVFCRASAFSRVDTIEVLVNGAVVTTDDVVAALGQGLGVGQSRTFFPDLTVAQGDRVEVQLTKPNAVSAWSGRALAQVV